MVKTVAGVLLMALGLAVMVGAAAAVAQQQKRDGTFVVATALGALAPGMGLVVLGGHLLKRRAR